MSTKPKGIVCYSADELKHFYIKGNGLNTEMEMGFEQTSDSAGLPIFINNENIYLLRSAQKENLQGVLSTIETNHSSLDVFASGIETNLNTEIATRTTETAANATAITTEQTSRIAGDNSLQTTIDGLTTSVGASIANIDS